MQDAAAVSVVEESHSGEANKSLSDEKPWWQVVEALDLDGLLAPIKPPGWVSVPVQLACAVRFQELQVKLAAREQAFRTLSPSSSSSGSSPSPLRQDCEQESEQNREQDCEQECEQEKWCIVTKDIRKEFSRYFTNRSKSFTLVSDIRQCSGRKIILWDRSFRFSVDSQLWSCVSHSFGQSEEWLTGKDALLRMVQVIRGKAPWFATSYRIANAESCSGILGNQLEAFLGDFHRVACLSKPNAWIVKPSTGTRSQHVCVSNNMQVLLKSVLERVESEGSCVICEYVTNPLLYKGYKFDLRFIVVLNSVEPFEAYVLNHFLVRRSLRLYKPNDFADVLPHLTVTQYNKELFDHQHQFTRLDDFSAWMQQEHMHDIYRAEDGLVARCHNAVRELLQLACMQFVEESSGIHVGLRQNQNARGIYGVDIIIRDDWSPVILEFNYKPDLTRVLEEQPLFLDQVLELLVLSGHHDGFTRL